jgi:hypothetical protein
MGKVRNDESSECDKRRIDPPSDNGTMNRSITVESRVRSVVKILETVIKDKHKIRVDLIERHIRAFDKCDAYLETPPEPQPLSGETWPPYLRTEKEKGVAAQFGKALTKLERKLATLESSPLRQAVLSQMMYGGAAAEFFEWKDQLARWRQHFEACAGQGKMTRGLFLKGDKSNKSKNFVLQREAAKRSAAILDAHSIRPATTPKRGDESKASVFIRIAEKIIGSRDLNVEYACRRLVEQRKANKVDYRRKSRIRASK